LTWLTGQAEAEEAFEAVGAIEAWKVFWKIFDAGGPRPDDASA